jgi:hypothetical protein
VAFDLKERGVEYSMLLESKLGSLACHLHNLYSKSFRLQVVFSLERFSYAGLAITVQC